MSRNAPIKKGQYYVWYLGWKEARGLSGREFTEPIVRELLARRQGQHNLPKLTVLVDKKNVKITQEVEKKKGKIEKVKYPSIPSQDIAYSCQALSPDRDVVACIFLGYNPYTNSAVHVHVYRCDSEETAAIMVQNFNQLIELPEHQKRLRKIERDLTNKGQITPRLTQPNDGHSSNASSRSDPGDPSDQTPRGGRAISDDIANDITPYDDLAAELQQKLRGGDAPILLPPKDYDTICRRHGNLDNDNIRKSMQEPVVEKHQDIANNSADSRADSGNGSGESDIPSPVSEYPRPSSYFNEYNTVPHMNQTYPIAYDAPYSLQRIFETPQVPQKDYDNYDRSTEHGRRNSGNNTYSSNHSNESGSRLPRITGQIARHDSKNSDHSRGSSGDNFAGYYDDHHHPPPITQRPHTGPRPSSYDSNFQLGAPDPVLSKHSRTRSSDEGYNTISDTAVGYYDPQHYMHDSQPPRGWAPGPGHPSQMTPFDRQLNSQDNPRGGDYSYNPDVGYTDESRDRWRGRNNLGASMPEVELRKQMGGFPGGRIPAGAVGVLPTRPMTANAHDHERRSFQGY